MKPKKPKKQKSLKKRLAEFIHSPRALRLLICVLGTAILMAIYVVAIVPVRYDLRVGMVPGATITATKDVEDTMATERARLQAANAVTPTYRYQEGVTEQVLADFDAVFNELRMVSQYARTLPDQSATRKYTREELDYARSMLTMVNLMDYQLTVVMQESPEKLEEAYAPLYNTLQTKMIYNVMEGQEKAVREDILQIVHFSMLTNELYNLEQRVLPTVLNACIKPNMVIDQEATEAARQEARNAVEPVMYKQGQNIVVKGEGRVTQSQLNMLGTLGLLSNSSVDSQMYMGAALMVLCVVLVMLWMIRSSTDLFSSWKKMLILFIVMVVTLLLSVAARLVNVYLAPVLFSAFLVTALLGMNAGIVSNAAITVLVASLAAGGSQEYGEVMTLILLVGLVAGTAGALVLQKKASRLQILLAGLTACAVSFAMNLALGLMTASTLHGSLNNSLWCAGGVLIAVLLTIGFQPLLETVFNLPTPMKLMELSNPNQPLLRKLMLEAPGTYHHSIIVANLAEAAAEAVGANPLLARVGGYYHDIGKLKRPSYFKENQTGEKNAHDNTDPYVSAAIVTAHTMDGVAMGRAYRLPQEVLEMIGSHHGDTPVMYFYHKAVQLASDGEPVDMDTFRYAGHPPKSAEAAILMLCDTIEAAVRTLQNPTAEAMEEFIVKLVRGKLEDGQLSDCPLTLRDIDKICAAVTTVLSGVFHERIEYPEMKRSNQQRIIHAVQEEKEAAAQDAVETKEEEPAVDASLLAPQMEVEPLPVLEMPKEEPVPVLDLEQLQIEPLPVKEEYVTEAPEAQEAEQAQPEAQVQDAPADEETSEET
ncbi:MAG: HDIG domain-containing protein [Clostridia bacterium]|nr:HDIG domain-containing protein [Clostridia bacterium]